MAQEPNKSEQLGTAENLAKYAPEYKQKDLAYMGSPTENEIIKNRMAKKNGQQYFIDGIDYQNGNVEQPNRKVAIYVHSDTNPNDNREIDEHTHNEPVDLMNYGETQNTRETINTDEKTALKFFKDIQARPNKSLLNDKYGIGKSTDLVSYKNGNPFRYTPSFVSKDTNPSEKTLKDNNFTTNDAYITDHDSKHNIDKSAAQESDKFLNNYSKQAEQNQALPERTWSKIIEAPKNQQDQLYNQYKEQSATKSSARFTKRKITPKGQKTVAPKSAEHNNLMDALEQASSKQGPSKNNTKQNNHDLDL